MANRHNPDIKEDLYCPECAHKGMSKLSTKAGSGRSRYKCPSCGHRTTSTIYTQPQILPEFKKKSIKGKKRFIITSAVNNTALVKDAHDTFVKMAERLDAAYLIIPGVYKNPALYDLGCSASYTWPAEIVPYLCNADIQLNKNLVIRGKTKIQYTAVNPLGGMNHAGDVKSEIFGHPQITMQMVPTPKVKIPKMMHTTGSISQKVYNESPTAKKAEFHHSIGALFIEIEGDAFWHTQIRFDGEGVMLYDKYHTVKGVKSNKGVSGIVYGDIHTRYLQNETMTCFNRMHKALNPKYNVFHDVHDHHIGSHHTAGNKIFALKQNKDKEFCIRREIEMSVKFLDQYNNAIVVDSNHDRHLDQWFNKFKPAQDPVNIDLYYELGEMCRLDEHGKGLFQLYVEKYGKNRHKFVGPSEFFTIEDVDVSQHGDRGPNGARGSAKAFSRTGYKSIIGHGHSPAIEKGCYQVGVSSFGMPYAQGYSSWFNLHCIIYKNGKRGTISLVNDKLPPLMRG